MPYKSEAQRRYFNSEEGKAKIGAEEVEHWNEASKGKELPEKVEDNMFKKTIDRAIKLTKTRDAEGGIEKLKSLKSSPNSEKASWVKFGNGHSYVKVGPNKFQFNSMQKHAIGGTYTAEQLVKKEGSSFTVIDARPRKSRDDNSFKVDKILKSAKSVNGQTYYVVQSGKWYVCTADKSGKHGGVFSLSLSDAMRDLKSWLKMDELKKKYGPDKWYHKWLYGEDSRSRRK